MSRYLTQYGSGHYVKKRSRFDKMKFKSQIGFNPKKRNPIIVLQAIGDRFR